MVKNGPVGHNEADSYSVAMRLLLHYVGDTHHAQADAIVLDPVYQQLAHLTADGGRHPLNPPALRHA